MTDQRPEPAVWLSGEQAARHVGVSWPTLRQVILDHQIPHLRVGVRWKIELAALDEHLRRLAEAHAAGEPHSLAAETTGSR